jgi:hypothetical protein
METSGAKKAVAAAGADRTEYMRNYMRAWRRNNPDKARATQENYWARRLARAAQQAAGGQLGTV